MIIRLIFQTVVSYIEDLVCSPSPVSSTLKHFSPWKKCVTRLFWQMKCSVHTRGVYHRGQSSADGSGKAWPRLCFRPSSWQSDHSQGLKIGSFGSSILSFLSSSYHLVWYFLFVSSLHLESQPHFSIWSFCFASLSNSIQETYMINSVCSRTLIVTVETGAHLWTGPTWRSMMKCVSYYFQIHDSTKKSKHASEQVM